MSSQFKQRAIMSTISIAGLAFAIYYSHAAWFEPIFVALTTFIICSSLYEYFKLAQLKGYQPPITLGLSCATAYVISCYLTLKFEGFFGLPGIILLASLALFFVNFFKHSLNSLANMAVSSFGIVYIVIPLTCLLLINYTSFSQMNHGRLWLAYVFTVTKITDMGAYIFGKTLGKTKLAESISPKKTVEGALGGFLVALSASVAFYFYVFPADVNFTLGQSLWLGLLISILAQFGDLAESILKRDAGVKDSSHLPGFGGTLDIVDSLVFTLPLMYLLLMMHFIG